MAISTAASVSGSTRPIFHASGGAPTEPSHGTTVDPGAEDRAVGKASRLFAVGPTPSNSLSFFPTSKQISILSLGGEYHLSTKKGTSLKNPKKEIFLTRPRKRKSQKFSWAGIIGSNACLEASIIAIRGVKKGPAGNQIHCVLFCPLSQKELFGGCKRGAFCSYTHSFPRLAASFSEVNLFFFFFFFDLLNLGMGLS